MCRGVFFFHERGPKIKRNTKIWDLSSELMRYIGHRKGIQKLTFRALAPCQSESTQDQEAPIEIKITIRLSSQGRLSNIFELLTHNFRLDGKFEISF